MIFHILNSEQEVVNDGLIWKNNKVAGNLL